MAVKPATPEIKGEYIEAPINRVFENTWNYNVQDDDMFTKQKNSLEKFDFVQPIVVREIPEGYEIVNGAHRYRAAQELNMPTVPVWNVGVVSDAYAQQLTIMLNELKGRPNVDNLASLIAGLDAQLGREEIVQNLPYSAQAIDDMINTLEFDWKTFEAEDDEVPTVDGKIDMVRLEFRVAGEVAREIESGLKRFMEWHKLEETDENRGYALLEVIKTWESDHTW
jgi:ParB/RepB/Spo0J family partition protein